jgi:flavoprotein
MWLRCGSKRKVIKGVSQVIKLVTNEVAKRARQTVNIFVSNVEEEEGRV